MAVAPRFCQGKSGLPHLDGNELAALIVHEEGASPLQEEIRLRFVQWQAQRTAEEVQGNPADAILFLRLVDPAVDVNVPGLAIGVAVAERREKDHDFIVLDDGTAAAKAEASHRSCSFALTQWVM